MYKIPQIKHKNKTIIKHCIIHLIYVSARFPTSYLRLQIHHFIVPVLISVKSPAHFWFETKSNTAVANDAFILFGKTCGKFQNMVFNRLSARPHWQNEKDPKIQCALFAMMV